MSDEHEGGIKRRDFLRKGAVVAGTAVLASVSGVEASVKERQSKIPRYGFLIDLEKCKGCFACAVACKEEFDVPLGVFRSQVIVHEKGSFPEVKRLFLPWLCNHCEKPICILNCPVGLKETTYVTPEGKEIRYEKRATFQRPDGLVLIDNDKIDSEEDRCIGCGRCVYQCPYKVRFLSPVGKGLKAYKCSLCVHRLDNGDKPACVKGCPHSVRITGDLNDPESEISMKLADYRKAGKKVSTLPSTRFGENDSGTRPACFYVGVSEEELVELYEKGSDIGDEMREL